MKAKLLNALLVITSLFGYLEWGKNNHMFLFEAEYEILRKLISDASSVVHPLILLPLFGQLLLTGTLFQQIPGRIMTFTGIACLAVLLLFMFFIGIISFNSKILFSTLPFMLVAILAILNFRKTKPVVNP
jgi:hypothetical protein